MRQLIIGSLQKSAVLEHDGACSCFGHSGSNGQRMLLGNADVQIVYRMLCFKALQPKYAGDGRINCHQRHVISQFFFENVQNNVGISFGRIDSCRFSGGKIPRRMPVKFHLVLFGRFVSLAL